MNSNLLRQELEELLKKNDTELKPELKVIYKRYVNNWLFNLVEKLSNNKTSFDDFMKECIEQEFFAKYEIKDWIREHVDYDVDVDIWI